MPVAFGHDAGDLEDVPEVVRGPGGEELADRDGAEGGMCARQLKLCRLEVECAQAGEIVFAKGGEFIEQGGERDLVVLVGFAIERSEGLVGAVFEDDGEARHPVDLLSVDEVADHCVGAPGGGAFGGGGPGGGEVAEEGVEGGGLSGADSAGRVP